MAGTRATPYSIRLTRLKILYILCKSISFGDAGTGRHQHKAGAPKTSELTLSGKEVKMADYENNVGGDSDMKDEYIGFCRMLLLLLKLGKTEEAKAELEKIISEHK